VKIAKPLALKQTVSPEQMDQKFKDIAKLYEKQFMREMVKAMRATTGKNELLPVSQGEKIFQEQLDQEYVEKWGDQGGLGLSDTIYKNLLDKYGEALGIRANSKQHGMLSLDPPHPTKALQKYKKD
jgi:flagellar protein FlgJ